MAADEGSLVMRRSKRSTAGNRMEAALAEFRAEDVGMDVEDDIDFIVEKDEEDAFESDFESTDEEAQAQEDNNDQDEKMAWDDERQARRANRSKLDRITAAAHARNKASFNPQLREVHSTGPSGSRLRRRVSMGSAIDAETGEVVEGSKRHSRRTHTMLNTSETATRIKDAEEKRSALPKKAKTPMKLPSQRELIERALKMEEGNIKEHREYLTTEEEKRKKARLVRTAVQGPLIRWLSKVEEETVREEPPQPPTPSYTYTAVPYHQYYPPPPSQVASTPTTKSSSSRSFLHVSAAYHAELPQPNPSSPSAPQAYPTHTSTVRRAGSSTSPASQPQAQSSASSWHPGYPEASQAATTVTPAQPSPSPYSQPYYSHPYYYYPHYSQPQPSPAPPEPVEHIEKVTKNYVIHELSQQEKQRPPWYSTMSAMFGDHVKWEGLRVYTSKGRPLSRPVLHCPITGKVAKYKDPRTNVPFADVEAYETLTRLLEHEYVWSGSLGCYTG